MIKSNMEQRFSKLDQQNAGLDTKWSKFVNFVLCVFSSDILRMLKVALGSNIPTESPTTKNPTTSPTTFPTPSHTSIIVSCSIGPVTITKSDF